MGISDSFPEKGTFESRQESLQRLSFFFIVRKNYNFYIGANDAYINLWR